MSANDPIAEIRPEGHIAKMNKAIFGLSIALFGALFPVGSSAQTTSCFDLRGQDTKASVSGILTIQLFAGPPNYESIEAGDAEERTFILELPSAMCAEDGEFIDRSTTFNRVHVSSSVPELFKVLKAAVGRQVTVRGVAFGSHTGHHHAPLVFLADEITVR